MLVCVALCFVGPIFSLKTLCLLYEVLNSVLRRQELKPSTEPRGNYPNLRVTTLTSG